MNKLLACFLIFFCQCPHAFGEVPESDCDAWFKAEGKVKGVMIVTHGLNLKAAAMNELSRVYAANGYEVFRPSFTGHCGKPETLQNVKADQWEHDARRFHTTAKARALELKVPLLLTSYSFSGLVFQSMAEELPFAKRVYLAPALETHFWYPLVIFLIGLWPTNILHTMIPDGYYAQEYSGTRNILAMNHFFLKWKESRKTGDSTPTLIWASLKDELVHGPKLKTLAESRPGWEFREISVAGCTLKKCFHHLIVDQPSLGAEEWKRVSGGSLEFLSK